MKIRIGRIGARHIDVVIEGDEEEFDLGLLDQSEAAEMAELFVTAAAELMGFAIDKSIAGQRVFTPDDSL